MAETTKGKTAPAREGFDQVIDQLRAVVEKLEGGSLGLEQSLAAFEDGVRLSRQCAQILDAAERRVELLTQGEAGEKVVPFPALDAAAARADGGPQGDGRSDDAEGHGTP